MRALVILGLLFGFAAAFVAMVVVAWLTAPLLVIGYFAVALALIIVVARR